MFQHNPVTAALVARTRETCKRLQVANGTRAMTLPTGIDTAPVVAAWAPLIPGQSVPMIGETVYDDLCFDD